MKKVHFRITLMMTILIAVLMILSALVIVLPGMQGREYGMNPAVTSSGNIQPNPTLNTNVSWSIFNSSWNPLEYTNGTANLTLNTEMSATYTNPISVNPTDIQSSFPAVFHSINLYNKTLWSGAGSSAAGAVQSTTNTSHSITYSTNESDAGSYSNMVTISIPTSDLPSGNAHYDYFTIAGNITAYTGMDFSPLLGNSTCDSVLGVANGSVTIIEQRSNPIPSGQTATTEPFWVSASLSQANLTLGTSSIKIGFVYTLPQTTADERISVTINNIAISTAPMTLGAEQGKGTQTTVQAVLGNAHLTSFAPNFQWSSITGNGYSVAVSQPLQNLTTQQSAVSTLNYIEQVEYQGQFNLPTAPDLSYGSANITERFNVSTSQTQVLDINGVSYLSTISGKNNTVLLLSSVNPNGQTQFLQIVDYTQSQWTSISSPPGIFSLPGLEYYWEEFIIAILAIVGVGAGAASRHASNLRKVK